MHLAACQHGRRDASYARPHFEKVPPGCFHGSPTTFHSCKLKVVLFDAAVVHSETGQGCDLTYVHGAAPFCVVLPSERVRASPLYIRSRQTLLRALSRSEKSLHLPI